jgi:hypothetical protein
LVDVGLDLLPGAKSSVSSDGEWGTTDHPAAGETAVPLTGTATDGPLARARVKTLEPGKLVGQLLSGDQAVAVNLHQQDVGILEAGEVGWQGGWNIELGTE